MQGEPIESVKVGLETMLASLCSNPFALESVWLCLITYDREARLLVPLTPLDEFQLPPINVPDSGPTHTGQALRLLCEQVDTKVQKSSATQKGDWRPLLFIMTDGKPSDSQLYCQMAEEVKKRDFAFIVPCAAGMKAKVEPLKALSDTVYILQTMDAQDFSNFFQWVSASIAAGNGCSGLLDELPPPPAEIIMS